ncbi:MAG: hypothetical protein NTY38_21310 [Acidobacteria bacterium]|nr:hypothetical protein [Acidobacteriota bacterium]
MLVQSAPTSGLTTHDKAYYSAAINFVRPGLILKVDRAEIAADGTIRAWLRITDPKSQPLDRLGVTTPGTVSASLVAAYIPKGETQYVSYTTRSPISPITAVTAIQAGADSGGTWTLVSDGYYVRHGHAVLRRRLPLCSRRLVEARGARRGHHSGLQCLP